MAEQNAPLNIVSEGDVVAARRLIREFCNELGFGLTDVTRIVTAASELTRNMYHHAGGGRMHWRRVVREQRIGIELVFEDEGPGLPDVDRALEEGYSTGRGLGMGLPGSRRLMDEFEIQSEPGSGTVVITRKWLR